MKRYIRHLFILTIAVCCFTPAFSQIHYETGKIVAGDTCRNYSPGINILNCTHIELYGNGGSRLWINTQNPLTYITGSGWDVYFYDRETGTYNDLRVSDLREHSNGEIYPTSSPAVLALLHSIRPVTYELKQETASAENEANQHIGVIAQELEQVLPQAVSSDIKGNKTVDYTSLLGVASSALKSIYLKMEENDAVITEIENLLKSTNQ